MISGLYGAPSCATLYLIMSIYLSNESRESFSAHDEFLLKQQRSTTITNALPCPLTPLLYEHICHMPTIFKTVTVHAVMINQLCRHCCRDLGMSSSYFAQWTGPRGSKATASLTDPSVSLPLTHPAPYSISNHLFGTTNLLPSEVTSNCSDGFTCNGQCMYQPRHCATN